MDIILFVWYLVLFGVLCIIVIMNNKIVKLDPRQALATQYYRDPASETFGNLKQSLIRAGFSPAYAQSHFDKDIAWIQHARSTVELVQGAEDKLKYFVERPINTEDESKMNREMIGHTLNASTFVLKTLAKSKYDPNEKDKGNTQVQVNIVNYSDKQESTIETKTVEE